MIRAWSAFHGGNKMRINGALFLVLAGAALVSPAFGDSFFFSTGDPDGKIATASRPSSASGIEIESADDFILGSQTLIDNATFTGLVPNGSTVSEVRVEIYRVFPQDSQDPPSGNVPTRVNSPSDVEFADRDTASSNLTFSTTDLGSFTATNSVLNGIHPSPNEFTGGEGSVTGEEVVFNVNFATPFDLPVDHYFFVPQVLLDNGDFFWLSAPKPIVPPGTPFAPDLQSWIRNDDLAPDWLRVGTDITHQGPFNAAFSLNGETVPEPASYALLGSALLALAGIARKRRKY
jgi:PEP-CTERM motif